jgi:hypothetical protein
MIIKSAKADASEVPSNVCLLKKITKSSVSVPNLTITNIQTQSSNDSKKHTNWPAFSACRL